MDADKVSGSTNTNIQVAVITMADQETEGKDLAGKNPVGNGSTTNTTTLANTNREIQDHLSELTFELKEVDSKLKEYFKMAEDRRAVLISLLVSYNRAMPCIRELGLRASESFDIDWNSEHREALLHLLLDEIEQIQSVLRSNMKKYKKQERQQFTNIVEDRLALGRRLEALLQDNKAAIEGLRASVEELIVDESDGLEIGGMTSLDLAFKKLEVVKDSALNARRLDFEGYELAMSDPGLDMQGIQAWLDSVNNAVPVPEVCEELPAEEPVDAQVTGPTDED